MKIPLSIPSIFTFWFIIVFLVLAVGFRVGTHNMVIPNLAQALANWDGGHFVGIAQVGYRYYYQYAFFPLYPLLIKLLSGFLGFYLSAFLVSLISCFLGSYYFYKLVRLDFSEVFAKRAVLLMLIFPMAFFFLADYSESLFFFLSVSSFYFLRKAFEKKIFLILAITCAALAGLTRLAGLVLIISLLVESCYMGFLKKSWVLVFSAVGFLTYCIYLFINTGNPFFFMVAEGHWHRALSLPWVGLWETLRQMIASGFTSTNRGIFSDFLFTVFGLGMIGRSLRYLRPSYNVFAIGSILLPLLTPSLSSMPRFLLLIFPIFITLALVKSKRILIIYSVFSAVLLILYSISYINGYWVS